MKHIMLDLETLSTENNAVILSVGACKFDPDGEDTYESFEGRTFISYIDPEEQIKKGRHVSWSTVSWWLGQSEEARKFLLGKEKYVIVMEGLLSFVAFAAGSDYIWGNGASFDNVILRGLFSDYGVKFPIHWRGDVCFRSLRILTENILPKRLVPEYKRYGTAHNALDDAITQALHVQQQYKALREYYSQQQAKPKPTPGYFGGGMV